MMGDCFCLSQIKICSFSGVRVDGMSEAEGTVFGLAGVDGLWTKCQLCRCDFRQRQRHYNEATWCGETIELDEASCQILTKQILSYSNIFGG